MWASFYSRTLTPSAAVVHKVKIHFFSTFFRASIVLMSHTQWRKHSGSKFFPGNYYPCFPTPPLYWLVIQRVNRGNLADQLRLLQFPQPGAHQHRPHTEDAVTPTNSLHQGDRPASLANPTGTRRGDSVIMTLFSRGVSAGQKRQPNNTVGAAAVHPDDELPTERWTHEKM